MNGRRLFREYAQSKGNEAREFVKIDAEQYQYDTLFTLCKSGKLETTSINYKDMVNWIIKTKL